MEKNTSPNITNTENKGATVADLRAYKEDLTEIDWNEYPKVTISMGETTEMYQKGIIRISIQHRIDGNEIGTRDILIQVDGLLSVVYSMYAKTLNDLRKATIRQKTMRAWGILRKLWEKLK
jgi:hypothetical protein